MGIATAAAVASVAVSAYSAYDGSKQAKKAAKNAANPKEYSNTTNSTTAPALDGASEFLRRALDQNANLYQRQRNRSKPPPRPDAGPSFRGPSFGQGSYVGASDNMQQIADAARGRALDTGFVDSAQGAAQNLFDGGSHPMVSEAFNQSLQASPQMQLMQALGFKGGGYAGESQGRLGDYADMVLSGAPPPQGDPKGAEVGGPTASAPRGWNELDAARAQESRAARHGRPPGQGGRPGGGPVRPGEGNYAMDPGMRALIDSTLGGEYLSHESNPYIQSMADQISKESTGAFHDANRSLMEQADGGVGMLGSSYYDDKLNQARGAHQDDLNDALNRLYYGNYESERGRQMETMGLLNNRDQARWGDQTARHGIDASERASNRASASASAQHQSQLAFDRERLAQEGELANRGLGLQAILGMGDQSLRGYELLSGNLLGDQGQRYGMMQNMAGIGADQQMNALGMVPGLNETGFYGYGVAGGLQQGIDSQNQQAADAQRADAWRNSQARYADAQRRTALNNQYQRDLYNYREDQGAGNFNDYLARLGGIVQAGGTTTNSTTQGVQPGQGGGYTGPSPVASGLAGGAGAGLSALGLMQTLRQGRQGSQAGPNTFQRNNLQ